MNKRTVGIAAVFLVGCAVGGASSQLVVPKASAQQAATLTKWEYILVSFRSHEEAAQAAVRLGKEGWEMSGSSTNQGGNMSLMWFKRPKM